MQRGIIGLSLLAVITALPLIGSAQERPGRRVDTERTDTRAERRQDRRQDAREDRQERRQDAREDAREDHQERRQDAREERQERREDAREEAREDRQERREDAREDRQERRQDAREDAREDRQERRQDARQDARAQRIRTRQSARAQRPVVNGHAVRTERGATTVTIRGDRFDDFTEVYIGDRKIDGARVSGRTISFAAPAGATGVITVRHGGEALVVGRYAGTVTERPARSSAERRTEAQTRWRERRAQLAAEEAERQAALEAREAALAQNRAERRRARLATIREQYEQRFLAQTAVQDEMALHAARVARIERMQRLVDVKYEDELAVRIEVLSEREDQRHEARMADLRAAFQGS